MISVIIPSYNSENTIQRCLDALKHQSYQGDFEIILVDSSIDRTPQIVSDNYPDTALIHLDKKTDPGTARNLGIREAKGDIFAFIDSDCVPSKDWLERIAAAHKSMYRIVGGIVKNGNADHDIIALAGYMAEFREFLPGQSRREMTHIPTCNISYKREIFVEYGFFHGEYYPQEDLVYNYMLTSKGEKILLDPAIVVSHNHRSNFKEFLKHQKKIGAVTPLVLRAAGLPGSFIVKHPIPYAILIPVLPVIKFLKTLIVFLHHQPKIIARRPMAIMVFGIGLIWWTIGFTQGMYTSRISKCCLGHLCL
jgi:glycosyltransferase involved in cell wall biosynthesis